jgi:hypothetical protein
VTGLTARQKLVLDGFGLDAPVREVKVAPSVA